MVAGTNRRLPNALAVLAIAPALACARLLFGAAQTAHWVYFHDPRTGLSFCYPPSLQVRRRDPRKFGLPRVEAIVDLMGNTKLNPGTVVLRFLVHRGYISAKERRQKAKELRRSCIKTSSMIVDGHKAVVCVSAGRAAVHWSVNILDPRECTILTLLGGTDDKQSLPPPHNGEFPLLTIIHTVRISSAATQAPSAH